MTLKVKLLIHMIQNMMLSAEEAKFVSETLHAYSVAKQHMAPLDKLLSDLEGKFHAQKAKGNFKLGEKMDFSSDSVGD